MITRLRMCGLLGLVMASIVAASEPDPFEDLDRLLPKTEDDDPFADLEAKTPNSVTPAKKLDKAPIKERQSWLHQVFSENFTLKKEIYSQFSYSQDLDQEEDDFSDAVFSRQSVGFEVLKKFSSKTSTVASFDFQGRLVRRDNFFEITNNTGEERDGWSFEVHNAYWDFYNVLNPALDGKARGTHVGRFNVRLGHFYLPLGINLQTDTHGTILQLSNERNLGFERDWYVGLWGSVNKDVNYDVYYMLGSGTDISFKGQQGLAGGRFSLANKYRIEYGLEAGIAFLGGERISKHAVERSPSVAADANGNAVVDTLRFGLDWRYTRSVPTGSLAFTTELSAGQDESDKVFTQLHQLEYLHLKRRFGVNAQYRRFWQDIGRGNLSPDIPSPGKTDASVFGEVTWYFRNDLGGANNHWIKLNVERQLEKQHGERDTIIMLQYYRYW